MPITPYTGTWGQVQRLHLLRRTLFGVSKSDIAAFANSTMTEMVKALLTFSETPPIPPLVDYVPQPLSPTLPSKDELGKTWVFNGKEEDRNNEGRLLSLQAWWAGLIKKFYWTINPIITIGCSHGTITSMHRQIWNIPLLSQNACNPCIKR